MELVDVLAGEGLVDIAVLRHAVERALSQAQSLVAVLVDDAVITEDVLAEVLARSVGSIVTDMESGALDPTIVQLLPEAVARRYLMVPVSLDDSHGSVRVAFANPLDMDAVATMRGATGLDVEPLVATVSGIRAAIDREYKPGKHGKRHKSVNEPPQELPHEITQRVESRRRRGDSERLKERSKTQPTHRLEPDASLEQRQEALLLALIERGVLTRADYIDALRRLLGNRDG